MDGRRDTPLSDEALDRELEAMLDVEPAPSFVATTRARLDAERIGGTWRPLWLAAWAGGVAAVVIGVVSLWPTVRSTMWSTLDRAAPSVTFPAPPAPRNVPSIAASGSTTTAGSAAPRGEAPPFEEAARASGPVPEPTPTAQTAPPGVARQAEPAAAVPPDVLIPAEETRGFELLLARLDQRLLDGSMVPENWGRRDEAARVVVDVMPIEIEPLMPLARPEGERP
jgi:hypothetical protein